MIFNLGGNSKSVVTADTVEYGNSNVAQALGSLEAKDVSLTNSISAVDTKTNNIAGSISTLENELTANGTRIYMDYQNGKYGYNTSPLRGADTFSPFSEKTFDYYKVKFPKFDTTLFIETGYKPTTIVFFLKNDSNVWYVCAYDPSKGLGVLTNGETLYNASSHAMGTVTDTGFNLRNKFGGSLENAETFIYVM